MRKHDIVKKVSSHQPITLDEGEHSASVMVLILVDEKNHFFLVLTKRADGLANYSGDYCFPGGLRENHDVNLQATAQRELKEELGLSSSFYQIIGQLDDFQDRYGNLVRPFVAVVSKDDFENNARISDEVNAIYYFPVDDLAKIKTDAALEKVTHRHPAYIFKNQNMTVWGLTASIMVYFNNIINQLDQPVAKYIDS